MSFFPRRSVVRRAPGNVRVKHTMARSGHGCSVVRTGSSASCSGHRSYRRHKLTCRGLLPIRTTAPAEQAAAVHEAEPIVGIANDEAFTIWHDRESIALADRLAFFRE